MDAQGLHIETTPREGDPIVRADRPAPCIVVLFGATGDWPSASSSPLSSSWRAPGCCPSTSPWWPSAARPRTTTRFARIVSTFMEEAVLDALYQSRYKPVTLEGRPVQVDYTFNLKLTLPK